MVEGSELQTVFRDGWNLEPANAAGGQITGFSSPQKMSTGVAVEVNFGFGNTLLGWWDGVKFNAIAGTSEIADAVVTIKGVECRILLAPDVDGGLGGPNFEVTEQDHVVFAVSFQQECPYRNGIARFESGNYRIIVANGLPVPGLTDTSFGASSLLKIDPDGTVALRSHVSRNSDVEQRGVRSDLARSFWQVSLDGNYKLLAAQGETFETNENTYVVDPLAVFGGAIRWVSTGYYGWREEFDSETALFIGRAIDDLPYANFDTVGASTLKYRLGTLDVVPAPFGASSFHDELRSFHLLDDGRALVFTKVNSIEGDMSTALWLSGINGELELIMKSGDLIPTNEGDQFAFVSELLSEATNLADGSVLIWNGSQAMFHIEFE